MKHGPTVKNRLAQVLKMALEEGIASQYVQQEAEKILAQYLAEDVWRELAIGETIALRDEANGCANDDRFDGFQVPSEAGGWVADLNIGAAYTAADKERGLVFRRRVAK